jgi:hypothetical protein
MATGNNLHIPDDLLSAVHEVAVADGRSTDDLAAEALRRYVAHRKLVDLGEYGRGQAERLGYTEADVLRLIDESRRGRSTHLPQVVGPDGPRPSSTQSRNA